MAYVINDNCTACGECLQICPNDAISIRAAIYRISPWFCTECLGFAEGSQCLEACPAGAIEPEAGAPALREQQAISASESP